MSDLSIHIETIAAITGAIQMKNSPLLMTLDLVREGPGLLCHQRLV